MIARPFDVTDRAVNVADYVKAEAEAGIPAIRI
jgi:hypothetical protein